MISCAFEDGHPALLRHLTVGAVVCNDKQEILLTKRAAHLRQAGKYCIPGGYLDRDENTKQGILRELKEETGLIGQVDFLFRIKDNPDRPFEDRQNVEMIYAVSIIGGQPVLTDEVTELKWCDKNTLPSSDQFAFDHEDTLNKYFSYLRQKFELPIIG